MRGRSLVIRDDSPQQAFPGPDIGDVVADLAAVGRQRLRLELHVGVLESLDEHRHDFPYRGAMDVHEAALFRDDLGYAPGFVVDRSKGRRDDHRLRLLGAAHQSLDGRRRGQADQDLLLDPLALGFAHEAAGRKGVRRDDQGVRLGSLDLARLRAELGVVIVPALIRLHLQAGGQRVLAHDLVGRGGVGEVVLEAEGDCLHADRLEMLHDGEVHRRLVGRGSEAPGRNLAQARLGRGVRKHHEL